MKTAPVPPVPIVESAAPEALMLAVPTVVRLVEATLAGVPEPSPGGAAKFTLNVIVLPAPAVESIPVPAASVMLPAVGLRAPPLDPVRVESKPVPGVIEPVIVEPAPANERVPVPTILIFPATGVAAPAFPVKVATAPVPPPVVTQIADFTPPIVEIEVRV